MFQVKPLGSSWVIVVRSCWKTETFALTKTILILYQSMIKYQLFSQNINIQIAHCHNYSEFLGLQKYLKYPDYYILFCFLCVVCLFWWFYGFLWRIFAIEKLEYSRYNAKIKYEWVCNSTYSSGLLSYTNGSHKGFVEFCVIEVFKFWVILRWMKE